ncbi:nonribosomal peptide synthetase MxaA [Methylotenera versatilis]|uniref:nonribosomal peptide synthetase MxaA n=1 Tax=Methylotenera versatilis TaxID=1055487 RepID=UPI000B26FBF3|nr:nonribosomal peptide synthetase MxaA [Methylotenera versatilis]
MMKKLMMQWIMSFGLLAFVLTAIAQDTEITAAKIIKISNPTHSNNIQVGAILTRQIELEVESPYQLSTETLPMKGSSQNGIELREIQVTTSTSKQVTRYIVDMRYQVFAAQFVPAVMQLPAEKLALTGGQQALSVNLPAWKFWFSPLVPKGITNAKENMQPQFKPTLIDVSGHHQRLWISLAMLLAGLIGLVYINADKRWLPFMNGAFATAHRKLKKLPHNPAGEKQALTYVHHAFNQVNGGNLFVNQLDGFLIAHPAFVKFKAEIEAFFERSNQSLFSDENQNSGKSMTHLIVLSRHLRDCERGV